MAQTADSDRHDASEATSRLAGSRRSRVGLALVLGVVLVGSLAYLLVLALEGTQLVRIGDDGEAVIQRALRAANEAIIA